MARKKEHQVIEALDGTVLYEGLAYTKRDFIQQIASLGLSLAGAKLVRADMSYLDLTGVDLTGSDLTGAILRGTILDDADLQYCILSGVKGDGMRGVRANFSYVVIKEGPYGPASFAGAVLTYADFFRALLLQTDITGIGASGASFREAVMKGVLGQRGWYGNADWRDSDTEGCNFDHSSFRSESTEKKLPEKSRPDLTVGASAVGNSYAGCKLPQTHGAFRRDRVHAHVEKATGLVASAVALLAASGLAEGYVDGASFSDLFKGAMGTGIAFIAATTAIGLLSDQVTDVLKDLVAKSTTKFQRFVRTCIHEVGRRAERLTDYVFALIQGPSRNLVRDIMSKGDGSRIDLGQATFMFVTRHNAAKSLAEIGKVFRRPGSKGDLVVVAPEVDGDLPSAVRFCRSGAYTAFWTKDAQVVGWKTFASSGAELVSDGDVPPGDGTDMRRAFEKGILRFFGAPDDFTYPYDTHSLRAGGDGSIVVARSSSSLPSNVKGGYVLVQPNGAAYDAKEVVRQAARELSPAGGPRP